MSALLRPVLFLVGRRRRPTTNTSRRSRKYDTNTTSWSRDYDTNTAAHNTTTPMSRRGRHHVVRIPKVQWWTWCRGARTSIPDDMASESCFPNIVRSQRECVENRWISLITWHESHQLVLTTRAGRICNLQIGVGQIHTTVSPTIAQRELIGKFYADYQELNETMPQIIIRFHHLWKQLTRPLLEEDLKETFLTTLQELLRTTMVVLDFKSDTLEEVINRVLDPNCSQNVHVITMGMLQCALPNEEELRFWHCTQCTPCLNPGHSTLECTNDDSLCVMSILSSHHR